jgi:hypothetical protein
MNKLPPTWQRLVLSVLGVLVIEGSWRWAVAHLYTLPPASLSGFVSLTTNAFYVIGAIIIFMVTGKLVYEWKMGSQQIQSVVSETQDLVTDAKESLNVKSNQPIGEINLNPRSPKDFHYDEAF